MSILECNEEISSFSSNDSEIEDLIKVESEYRSDTSGSEDGHEAGASAFVVDGLA